MDIVCETNESNIDLQLAISNKVENIKYLISVLINGIAAVLQ